MKIPKLSVPEVRRCWRRSAVLLSWIAISIAMLFSPMDAKAFKAETHVWVGQQVLNDVLPDGIVTIFINGVPYYYSVDPPVVSALQANSDIYRMGNIGPDAFPDMYTGQFVVHPGITNGWQTDDWLKWIYKGAGLPQEKAFAYGYLAHAATDVFSHTYVNNYSGDIFVLGDGETQNEIRHFALEKYIVQHTPPLKDANGVQIGQPYSVLNTPASFINNNLILNNTVAAQYGQGGAPHLEAIQKLRERLNKTYGPLGKLDTWIIRVIAEYKFNISLNNEQAGKVFELAQNINQIITNNNGFGQLQKAKDDLVNAVVTTGEIGIDLQNRLNSALNDVLQLSAQYDAKIIELAEDQKLYDDAFKACFDWNAEACKRVNACDFQPTGHLRDSCRNTCNNAATTLCNGNLQLILGTIQVVTQAKMALEGELLQASGALTDAVGLIVTAANENLLAQNEIINGLIETTELMTKDLNMMRAEVDGWRSDIVLGMDAYVLANAEVIKESMKDGGDMLQPLKYWLDCWGASVTMGIPSPLNNGLCSVQNRVEKMSTAISNFETRMGKLMEKIVPLLGEWNDLKQRITNEIEGAANKEAMDQLEKKTGVDVAEIMKILKDPMDAATLNTLFSSDDSGKYLPLIQNIAQIIDTEMQLTPDGYFDPDKYEVAHNSVVLAKLALLNRTQLNKFATDAGVTLPTIYGDQLYPEDGMVNSSNIIFGFIRSIDGNHQWLEFAPPYPRQANHDDPKRPDERRYGYGFMPSADGYTGLRIWEYSNARENAFLRVFSGSFFDPGIQDLAIYNLSISKAAGNGSGTVTSSPYGVSCGTDCNEHYVQGATITLTASPSPGSLFAGWAGGGCSGTGTCAVTMSGDINVTAIFNVVLPEYGAWHKGHLVDTCNSDELNEFTCPTSGEFNCIDTYEDNMGAPFWRNVICGGTQIMGEKLTVSKAGTGSGTVASDAISCGTNCSELYAYGSTVTLHASPSSGSLFSGWSGGGCSGTGACTVTMYDNITITANFSSLPKYNIAISKAGTGSGTVASNPAGISCGTDCSEPYIQGAAVTLTASPASGSLFAGWSGGGCSGTGTCTVTMTADKSITATFNVLPKYTLTISKAGTGSGTVTSNPAGISCGTDCTEQYVKGTTVTLTASPSPGSSFAGWSGGGTGSYVVTINANTTVTPIFNQVGDVYGAWNRGYLVDTCNANDLDVFTCPASGAFNCIDTYEDNMGAPFWRNVSCY